MKHEVLKAEIKEERLGFLFECNYFDNTGNINSTKRFRLKYYLILKIDSILILR